MRVSQILYGALQIGCVVYFMDYKIREAPDIGMGAAILLGLIVASIATAGIYWSIEGAKWLWRRLH